MSSLSVPRPPLAKGTDTAPVPTHTVCRIRAHVGVPAKEHVLVIMHISTFLRPSPAGHRAISREAASLLESIHRRVGARRLVPLAQKVIASPARVADSLHAIPASRSRVSLSLSLSRSPEPLSHVRPCMRLREREAQGLRPCAPTVSARRATSARCVSVPSDLLKFPRRPGLTRLGTRARAGLL